MSRIIIEYNPPLTIIAQKIIKKEVTPSMVSKEDETSQYVISMVAECLTNFIKQGIKGIDFNHDLNLINELMDEGVHYIEI